ncbi:MAG: ABC transporter ATP-binding protein, partial [Verrucomicrobiota bacterium]
MEPDNGSNSSLLSIRDLTIETRDRHGDSRIGLRHFSLKVCQGEIVVLAGESGCGHSLLGEFMFGILPNRARVVGGEAVFEEVDL